TSVACHGGRGSLVRISAADASHAVPFVRLPGLAAPIGRLDCDDGDFARFVDFDAGDMHTCRGDASGGTGEVVAANAFLLVGEMVQAIGVEHLPVVPEHLGRLGIDLECLLFAYCKPFLFACLGALRLPSWYNRHSDHMS